MKADPRLLAQMYHATLVGFVRDGRAPHYTDLGRQLGLRMEEARQTLHQLMGMGLPTWLAPHTDYIASFAPFSNIPTQYLVSVDQQQRWYAQCGFECLAISWLFPGKNISIDSPCLDCGELITVRMRDGSLLAVTPLTVVGHVGLPAWRWRENWAHTRSQMNLFQSEEHVRAWTQFDRSSEDGIRPLRDLATTLFCLPRYRERLAPDYLLRATEFARDLPAALERLGRSSPFWRMSPPQ